MVRNPATKLCRASYRASWVRCVSGVFSYKICCARLQETRSRHKRFYGTYKRFGHESTEVWSSERIYPRDRSQSGGTTTCASLHFIATIQVTRVSQLAPSGQVPFPINVKELIRPKAVTVRLYVIKAEGLAALDGGNSSDPYLCARLGDTEFSCRDQVVKDTLKPYFGHCFQFETLLPGPTQLQLAIYDWDVIGKDDLIGTTTIDLEDRYFSPEWRALSHEVSGGIGSSGPPQRCWPIETRTLRDNGSFKSRGKVQCWVDVLPKAEARAHTPIDIAMAPPEEFELRVILYRTRKVPIMDPSSGSNDAYVTASLTTVDTNGRSA